MMKILLLLTSFLLSAGSSSVISAEVIPLVTYHITPPFIIDKGARIGLTYDLANLLTEHSDGQFHFEVQPLPRKRLDSKLERELTLVVPWVNQHWFKDPKMELYLWTSELIPDSNAVISSAIEPVEYTTPQSLTGKTLVGLLGGRWTGVDRLVKRGQITRIDTNSYLSAMMMVLRGRANATIMPLSVAKYHMSQQTMFGDLRFSARPHSNYSRRLLIKGRPDIKQFIENQIAALQGAPKWNSILKGYGFVVAK